MSNVLVTGADGFIGSHLVEKLIERGESVRALCMYNSSGSWGWLDSISEDKKNNLEVILGDIRDPFCVKNIVNGCEKVYHLAALIAIPYSYKSPSSYVDTNIHGTLNILEACKELNVSRIIHTSTSETYGTAQFVPITEDHPLVAQSPYAASKIGADQLALSYFRSFGTPVSVLRPFNTYGPRQSTRAVIPTIITQIASGNKEIFLGAVSPTRDFNFVSDICNAFIEVGESNLSIGKVINASSNFEISIGETASLISDIMNQNVEIISEDKRLRPELSEVNRLYGDNTLIKNLTNWEPIYIGKKGFKKALYKTCEWFMNKENLSKYRIGEYII